MVTSPTFYRYSDVQEKNTQNIIMKLYDFNFTDSPLVHLQSNYLVFFVFLQVGDTCSFRWVFTIQI